MSSQVVFGPASIQDLPAVVELCMLVEQQHETYWPVRWQLRTGLAQGYLGWLTRRVSDPRFLIHVAKEADAVVGMIIVSINEEIPIYTYTEFALIQDMAVRETHRRRGIAQQLLQHASQWAKTHGLNQLRLMVADKNPSARAAFEKAGFKPTYVEMILPLQE